MAVLKCLGWFLRALNKVQLIFRRRDSKMPLPMKSKHGHRIAAGKEKAFTEFLLCGDADFQALQTIGRENPTGEVLKIEPSLQDPRAHQSCILSFIHSKGFATEKLRMQISRPWTFKSLHLSLSSEKWEK